MDLPYPNHPNDNALSKRIGELTSFHDLTLSLCFPLGLELEPVVNDIGCRVSSILPSTAHNLGGKIIPGVSVLKAVNDIDTLSLPFQQTLLLLQQAKRRNPQRVWITFRDVSKNNSWTNLDHPDSPIAARCEELDASGRSYGRRSGKRADNLVKKKARKSGMKVSKFSSTQAAVQSKSKSPSNRRYSHKSRIRKLGKYTNPGVLPSTAIPIQRSFSAPDKLNSSKYKALDECYREVDRLRVQHGHLRTSVQAELRQFLHQMLRSKQAILRISDTMTMDKIALEADNRALTTQVREMKERFEWQRLNSQERLDAIEDNSRLKAELSEVRRKLSDETAQTVDLKRQLEEKQKSLDAKEGELDALINSKESTDENLELLTLEEKLRSTRSQARELVLFKNSKIAQLTQDLDKHKEANRKLKATLTSFIGNLRS